MSREVHSDDKLARAGFDSAAAAPDALAKLRELRSNPAISPSSIARVLGDIADPAAAAMLVEMETGASGPLRREIRRSLYKLHQRGVERPPATPDSGAGSTGSLEPSGIIALFSPIDSEGVRMIWMTKPRTQGGMARLWGIVSEDEGLVGVIAGNIGRRELRQERDDLAQRAGVKLVEGDWRLADFILCEAYRRTPEARRGKVGNFLALRTELFTSPPPLEIAHPVYSELASEISNDPSPDLLKEPEIADWKLTQTQLRPYLDELNRANESTIVLNAMQQQDRVGQILERAVTELFGGESGLRMRRRLEDTAYYMLKSGRRQQAGWAASAAARIRDGADLKRLGFFQALIRMQMGSLVAEEQQRVQEEPRLIVTPAEAMRASEAARRQRRR